MSRRLRSITNFFLANLAVADFCVGTFCVYQNLSLYLISNWILGDFLCKMYHFTTSLSYTASIFILVVICTERYFAIIYPITCKQILTPKRLRLVILGVWLTSALYSSPKFFWCNTITHPNLDNEALVILGVWLTSALYSSPKFFWCNTITHPNLDGTGNETICATNRLKYNSEMFDTINFVLLYIIPLGIMTLLYTRIAVGLWRSSRQLEKQLNASNCNTYQSLTRQASSRYKHQLESKWEEENTAQKKSTKEFKTSENMEKPTKKSKIS
ncbi:7 transmembrane receptor (rhodopsin family) [Popillia japonica]|uniref:7 transmembrane receptor (Rhodopsin family) n=1 Tax=Popillia japonica TaxID=7064 RepID=A0AAW1KMX1_POPJA